jgi:dCTP diphosphatase
MAKVWVAYPPIPMSIQSLQIALQEFAQQREWDKFHTPKNLSMALAGEAGELLELFQWLTTEESLPANLASRTRERVQEEMADVFLYLIRLADKLDVDLEAAAQQKLVANAEKYPVDLSTGNAVKYNRRHE